VETKKKEAKTQAAVAAMQGMNTPGNKEKDLTKRLWSGDSVGVLKDLLSGRK
jgi:hypothetical protein